MMAYQPYYPGGWQPGPSGNTPITADALNHMETQYDAVMAETTSPGGTEPERLAVTDQDGAVGLAKDTQAVGGVLASGIARIATGSYVGNGSTSDRLIHVGFAPLMVYVVGNSGRADAGLGLGMAGATHGVVKAASVVNLQKQGHSDGQGAPVPTATGFVVRGHASGEANLNASGITYTWVAIGAVGS